MHVEINLALPTGSSIFRRIFFTITTSFSQFLCPFPCILHLLLSTTSGSFAPTLTPIHTPLLKRCDGPIVGVSRGFESILLASLSNPSFSPSILAIYT